ncbi:MAG: hypothetical protein ACOCZ6_04450 [Nanoarchaeota archaeon]
MVKAQDITEQNGRRVIKDTPLVEITLRKYEMPYDTDERELLKKFCLSIGLLQPGDSRDIVVDVLHVLLKAKRNSEIMDSENIRKLVIELRNKEGLPLTGVASSNIRRQLKRLRDLHLAEKIKNQYRITEFESMLKTFEEKIEDFILPSIIKRVKEYFKEIDNKFS